MKLLKTIVLLGIKHSGKTSQGRLLAQHYNVDFADIDSLIFQKNGSRQSIRELYRSRGLQWFMEQELEAISDISRHPVVIATGGGSMENDKLMKHIGNQGWIILFIDAPEEMLWNRIISQGLPPFLEGKNPGSQFSGLYAKRRELGRRAAHIAVPVTQNGQSAVTAQLIQALDSRMQEHH